VKQRRTCEPQWQTGGCGGKLDLQRPLLLAGDGDELEGVLALHGLDDKFGDAVLGQRRTHLRLHLAGQGLQKWKRGWGGGRNLLCVCWGGGAKVCLCGIRQ